MHSTKAGVLESLKGWVRSSFGVALASKMSIGGSQVTRNKRPVFEPLEPRLVLAAGPVVISEFLAINDGVYPDGDGDFSDWIELHNPTDARVDLDGWYLTDNPEDLEKWEFPEVGLDPDEYLVVFASGKHPVGPPGELHTSFKLDGDGEYLALVRADGTTVAHEFAPEFPEQRNDVSYGTSPVAAAFTLEGTGLSYLVPTAAEAGLAATWTAPGFDDSAWSELSLPPRVLITEAGTGDADFIEIQNLSGEAVDTSGWVAAVNNAYDIGHPAEINAWYATLWHLPDSMVADEIRYRTDIDDGSGNWWGENVFWRTSGSGGAMILDDEGHVVDFAVWGYSPADVAALDVTINGHHVTAEGIWTGDAIPVNVAGASLQRGGATDHDDASDFAAVAPPSMGLENDGLVLPFSGHGTPGMGFELDPPGLAGAILLDVGAEMHGVNASLWTRIPFRVGNPATFDSMRLRVKYNDGFVAYVNGREVARRNAPDSPQWNSHATAARSDAESVEYEEIDLSDFLDELVAGTNVLAVHALNESAADADFLILPQLSVTSPQYFREPTPGEPNGAGFLRFVQDTQFSVDRGFYEEPFQVEITSETFGATIYYTLDGRPPDEETGTRYSGPLTISTTTTLRAAAFRRNCEPSNVDTQTYIFLDDVIRQPPDPPGFPSTWAPGTSANYEMDPYVVNDPRYRGTIEDDLRAIPTISLVLAPDDLWDPSIGIYSNTTQHGVAWERPASVELIDGDGQTLFQLDAGLRIQGGASRGAQHRKHSLRLLFKDVYGPTKLKYPLFGDEATDRFDTITLRAGFNDKWSNSSATYLQDRWTAQTQNEMGGYGPHGGFVHLYLNGLYWGLYNPVERPSAPFAASYLGGEKEDYDAIVTREFIDGNSTSWNQLRAMVAATPIDYAAVGELLDIPNLIDYMIVNQYGGNWDWPHNNWYATHSRQPGGKWRFHSWDAEGCLRDLSRNKVEPDRSWSNGPGEFYLALRQVEQFRDLFAQHVHRHLFNGGLLTPEANVDRLSGLAAQIDRAIVGESARWGDGNEDTGTPRTRDDHWLPRLDWLRNTFFRQRGNILIQQYRAAGLYPLVDAPVFNRHGGRVPIGFELRMIAPAGTIYYTLDGSDPRLPGGGVSEDALVFDGTPIPLNRSAVVKARALDGIQWSALNEAQFFVHELASAENLTVTELNYNPYDPTPDELAANADLESDDFEFIELQNTSRDTITLSGVRFTDGIEFDFTGSPVETLAPGEYAVVASNPAALQRRYGEGINLAGQYEGRLRNQGEPIRLLAKSGDPIVDFAYNDENGWPGRADGKGASLELIDPAEVPPAQPQRTEYLENDDHWRSSGEYGGTPASEGKGLLGDVLVNEVLTHTHPFGGSLAQTTTDGKPSLDTIELINTTGTAIDVGGWYLSDSWGWESDDTNGNYKKFRIPEGTTIPALGYVVFDEDDFNPSGGVDPELHPYDFALNGAQGDDVWLMEADAGGKLTRFVDHVEFGAAAEGESWGRWPNGQGDLYPMITPTLDKDHPQNGENSGPRLGEVIFSEVHYNPELTAEDDDLEFIEIYNSTGRTVDLTNWHLGEGIDYDFPAGKMLGPYSELVILPFDLSDADEWLTFCTEYALDVEATGGFLGGYRGRLSDEGERVQLQRPDEEPDEQGVFPPLLEDAARYDDESPWPVDADGGGASLHRAGIDTWGNTHLSWNGLPPTPGQTPFEIPQEAQVVGRHVFYNGSRFDGNCLEADARDDDAIAPDKVALLPGETATLANYTSYCHGINGIMVDIAGLPEGAVPDVDDFRFRMGNSNNPSTWGAAAMPGAISVRPGAGADGADRITIIWDDNSIQKQWLQVTVLVTADTRLAEEDVFYFGNAIGESGNSSRDAKVNAYDMLGTRDNQRTFINPAPIDFAYDFNRDARVNTYDMLIARDNQTHFLNALKLITVPDSKAAASRPLGGGLFQTTTDGRSAREETPSGPLDWLRQFEQPGRGKSSVETVTPIVAAVDKLLADDDR